jgi:hypothetical protein
MCRAAGLHGLADDLRRGGDRDAVEFFTQRADQNRVPEARDSILRLAVRIEPLLERLSVVALHGQRQWDQGACDRQLVGSAQEREVQE